MNNRLYLAIETSCDETSLAILQSKTDFDDSSFYNYLNSFEVLASITSSQISTHIIYGGVVPEIGAREHADHIHSLFELLINETQKSPDLRHSDKNILESIDRIIVTAEPGLASALRVGVEFAKSLKFFLENLHTQKPVEILSVNHLQGHIASAFYHQQENCKIEDKNLFPHLHLLVSGGNSQLILLESPTVWTIVGQTLDDAAGECLDKIGRMVGLPYPGGVNLAKIAKMDQNNYTAFPIGMSQNKSLNYSFSGLKTAVRYFLQDKKIKDFTFENKLMQPEIDNLVSATLFDTPKLQLIYSTCVSAQFVVIKQLVQKYELAIEKYKPSSIAISGGVSANNLLRSEIFNLKDKYSLKHVFVPEIQFTGDNAVMIGLTGLLTTL